MRASWTAAAIIVAALALPVAAEAATAWRVSGTITGPYDSSMSWVNCPLQGAVASFSEHADVDVKMRPRFKSDFPRGSFRFGALVVGDVGGRWSLNGTYPPRQGSEGCGAPVAAS